MEKDVRKPAGSREEMQNQDAARILVLTNVVAAITATAGQPAMFAASKALELLQHTAPQAGAPEKAAYIQDAVMEMGEAILRYSQASRDPAQD